MKKLLLLLVLTSALSAGAMAHNGEEQKQPAPGKTEGKAFQLNKDFLSIFNIFSFTSAPADSARKERPQQPVMPKSRPE